MSVEDVTRRLAGLLSKEIRLLHYLAAELGLVDDWPALFELVQDLEAYGDLPTAWAPVLAELGRAHA